jgi:glycogen(starch) synthase
VTCVSENVLKHTRELVPEITEYSSVLYNGLPEPSVASTPLPFQSPRLLCIGRLVPEKGIDLALRAFALLTSGFPTARLIIAGDGLCRDDLQSQARELGLAGVVDFIGWVAPDRIPALINGATLVVLPSRSEALPTVAIEAGMMGRPVVAARVGGVPEVVVDRETGLLIDPEDFESLARAIRVLLRQPTAALSFGRAARRRVQTLFGFEQYVEGYDTLYRNLAGRRLGPSSALKR